MPERELRDALQDHQLGGLPLLLPRHRALHLPAAHRGHPAIGAAASRYAASTGFTCRHAASPGRGGGSRPCADGQARLVRLETAWLSRSGTVVVRMREPGAGLEPATLRLQGERSTSWPSPATGRFYPALPR